jgi:hypothetical protein
MATVLVVIMIGGLGLLFLMGTWRRNMETQLRLNRCVAEHALALRTHLNLIEGTNTSIQGFRVMIRAAEVALQFEAIPPLIQSSEAVVLIQSGSMATWEVKRAAWMIKGCGKWGDIPVPLPIPPFRRGEPDTAGPQLLEWRGRKSDGLKIQISHWPRSAAAKIRPGSQSEFLPGLWGAEWTGFF